MRATDKPILSFAEAIEFRVWLSEHHAGHGGIWLRYFKKASGQPTILHAEAVDEALCWGWIDGRTSAFGSRLSAELPPVDCVRCG